MNGFWWDRLNNTCSLSSSYFHCAFYIYRSKVEAHYRSTLFADLNLEITYLWSSIYMQFSLFILTTQTNCYRILDFKWFIIMHSVYADIENLEQMRKVFFLSY